MELQYGSCARVPEERMQSRFHTSDAGADDNVIGGVAAVPAGGAGLVCRGVQVQSRGRGRHRCTRGERMPPAAPGAAGSGGCAD